MHTTRNTHTKGTTMFTFKVETFSGITQQGNATVFFDRRTVESCVASAELDEVMQELLNTHNHVIVTRSDNKFVRYYKLNDTWKIEEKGSAV